jgi:hypothetical protein
MPWAAIDEATRSAMVAAAARGPPSRLDDRFGDDLSSIAEA